MSRLLDNEGHADAHEPVEREVREQGDPEQGPIIHVFSIDIHPHREQTISRRANPLLSHVRRVRSAKWSGHQRGDGSVSYNQAIRDYCTQSIAAGGTSHSLSKPLGYLELGAETTCVNLTQKRSLTSSWTAKHQPRGVSWPSR